MSLRIHQIGDLEVFAAIIDRGSLAEASRTLGLTKNAVTRSLARLEDRLGKTLLLRTTRTVSSTEDGRLFYEHCRRILREVTEAEEALVDGDTLRGTLRVGMPTRMLYAANLRLLGEFLVDNPHLDLQIVASDQPFDLIEQRIDVAIAVGELPDSSLLQRKVTTLADVVLAAAPSYIQRCGQPKRLSDLEQHDCLRFQTDQPQRAWTLIDGKDKAHEVSVGGSFCANDSRVLDTAMRAGLGIGLVTRSGLKELRATGELAPILPRYRFAPFLISLVYQRHAARSRRLDGLLDVLAHVVQGGI